MIRFIALVAASSLIAIPALAGDISAPSTADWSGLYVGGNLGGGKSSVEWEFHNGTQTAPDGGGALGGIQAGYNFQNGGWVWGGEADFSLSSIDGDDTCPNPSYTCYSETKWLATVRGRLGYSFGNLLVYGTGGAGFGRFEMGGYSATSSGSDTKTRTGWVAGAGAEYAMSKRWSVKLEYLHYDFGKSTYEVNPGSPAEVDHSLNTGRIGVNFRF